ncbi:MAG: acyl-CoA dehydrogenase family protein, partial [Limnohabitans sp.]
MNHPAELNWPFFDDAHRDFKVRLDAWCNEHLAHDHHDESRDAVDAECVRLVRLLGNGGWLAHAVAGRAYGAASDAIDTRLLCLLRETFAFHNGLADFAFAMQGLGTGAISLWGSAEQKQRYLPRVASGQALSAFALSEPEAGSDVAAMQCSATAMADGYVRDGRQTWSSNGGIADVYVVFARTGEQPGARGITAFIVDADSPGLTIEERINVVAPHPLATLKFDHCMISAAQRIGEAGQGFKVAMATLDVFRTSVAAAALGFGRRALHESVQWA